MSKNNDSWKKYRETIISKLTHHDIYGDIKNQKPSGDDYITGLCPFHNDTSSSFAYHKNRLTWGCFAGCGKGSAFDFVMFSSGGGFKDVMVDLGDKLGIPKPAINSPKRPIITEEMVKGYMAKLKGDAKQYLLEKRGFTDTTIEKYQIGWDANKTRYTIPIRDEKGKIVNIRLYNTKHKPKILNYTDGKWKYGSPARLYGVDELVKSKDKQVIFLEGESDRILLQQEGFIAVTGTHGCSTLRPEWITLFKDKDVVVIFDCDKEGQTAVKNIVLKAFKNSHVNSIKNVILPLKGNKDDKDITDYLIKHDFTKTDLQKIIDETPIHKYDINEKKEDIVKLKSFSMVEDTQVIDKKIECDIVIPESCTSFLKKDETMRITPL